MRISSATLAWFALFTGLASAQSGYGNPCSSNPTGELDVEPGIVATYGCGQIHDRNQATGEQKAAASPKDCASECAKRSPEGPCSWHGGTCYFYNPGTGAAGWPDSATIVVRKDWNKMKAAYDQSQLDLRNCRTGGGGGPPGGSGGGPPGGSGGGPPGGNGGGGGTLTPGQKTCPQPYGSSIVTNQGKKFDAWCGAATQSGATPQGPATTESNLEDCLNRSNGKGSTFAIRYEPSTGSCQPYSSGMLSGYKHPTHDYYGVA